jgi:hypothetical protein
VKIYFVNSLRSSSSAPGRRSTLPLAPTAGAVRSDPDFQPFRTGLMPPCGVRPPKPGLVEDFYMGVKVADKRPVPGTQKALKAEGIWRPHLFYRRPSPFYRVADSPGAGAVLILFRIARPSIGGSRLSDPGVLTNLALRSIQGARLAIAPVSVHGVIAQEVVDASLVGSRIGDGDTGIVGVCLCWWNAEGYQCYDRCRRHAH